MSVESGAGGVIGFMRARSMTSLIGGLGSSALMLGSAFLIQNGDDLNGHALGCATSTSVAAGMGYRAMAAKKGRSAGLIALVAAASAAYHGKKVNDWR